MALFGEWGLGNGGGTNGSFKTGVYINKGVVNSPKNPNLLLQLPI